MVGSDPGMATGPYKASSTTASEVGAAWKRAAAAGSWSWLGPAARWILGRRHFNYCSLRSYNSSESAM